MDLLEKISNRLAKKLHWIAGAAIVSMILLTCADIILRLGTTVYRDYHWPFLSPFKPIPGTYELVCFMGAVAVSFAMAHTSVKKGHVSVSFLVRLLPQRTQALIEIITHSLGFIFFALLSWQSVMFGNDLITRGDVSLTLQLPYYPFVYGIGLAAAAVCLVLLVELSKHLIEVFDK